MGPATGDAAGEGAWEAYWDLTRETSALKGGGPLEEALGRLWERFVGGRPPGRGLRLDVACGNGAVTAAGGAAAPGGAAWVGLDRSASAARAYRDRFPGALAVTGEAGRLPFADGSFDVVGSQFGIEYAGLAAFDEAARVTAPGGLLAAVVHMAGGALCRECRDNAAAVERLAASGVLGAAKETFRRGAAALRGHGSQAAFRDAQARLAAAAGQVDGILAHFGPQVAGGTVQRLRDDLAHMAGRIGAYDPAEVAGWADHMARETEAYAGRMAAALGAALDGEGIGQAAARCARRGLTVRLREELLVGPGGGEPAAWVLVCERR